MTISLQTWGLLIYVVVLAVQVGALVLDVGLELCGVPMITTEARAHVWFMRAIIAFSLIGTVALRIHFLHYRRAAEARMNSWITISTSAR